MMDSVIETMSRASEVIISVASLVTALLVILQTFTKYNPFRPLRKWFLGLIEERLHKMDEKIDCIHVNQKQLRIDQLRLIVASEDMPLSERVKAGDEYVNKLGQNGAISVKYALLRDKLRKEMEGEN